MKETLKTIGLLKNTVQEYPWGSYTAIAELLGEEEPSDVPQAELWMGAHPKAPSRVKISDKWVSLAELIDSNPEDILGGKVRENFGDQLPYLFKVLAAAQPLSIQAHPNLAQAREGFRRENRHKVPLNAPERNYKDKNHKPECICALTPFWALCGFRKIPSILALMSKLFPPYGLKELDHFHKEPNPRGLQRFFKGLMTMDLNRQKQIIGDAMVKARRLYKDDVAFKWMLNLDKQYPGDIGVFSPLILNLVCLKPGQALFLPAGELHAYLDGVGIELMANSDNVLRGGLTQKHVDVTDLLKILNFEEKELSILSPVWQSDSEHVYVTPAKEFVLSVLTVAEGMAYWNTDHRGADIILCTQGEASVTDVRKDHRVTLSRGTSVLIPAVVESYRIEGNATLYKAAVSV